MSLDAIALEVAESTDVGRGVHCGHRRAAQGGLLGPVHPRRRPAAAAAGRPACGLRRGPAGPAGLRRRRRDLLRRRQGRPRIQRPAARGPLAGPVRPRPARRGGAAAGLHARCTCASPTPRCPDPGSARCERPDATPRTAPRRSRPCATWTPRTSRPSTSWNAGCSRWMPGRCRCSSTSSRRRETRRYLVAELARRHRGLRRADVHRADRGRPDHRRRARTGRQGHRLGPADRADPGKPAPPCRRTCCWKSARTTPGPSSSTGASASNRSTSGPATTATASTP